MSEEAPEYGYRTPSYLEAVQSQLPALRLLMSMGWEYLTPAEANALRGGRRSSPLLEEVLTGFIRETARVPFKGEERPFTENAVLQAVQALKSQRAVGALYQNEEMYDLLCLGTSVPQTVEGDTKSFSIQYIDWKHPERNRYHCTAEFSLERTGQQKHHVPDIVLFVNGIPLVVMECKRAAYDDHGDPLDRAIGQIDRYQAKDGIPQLFLYSQLHLALARDKAVYGTTGTERKFWAVWREEGIDGEIERGIRNPVPEDSPLCSAPFERAAEAFRALQAGGREVTEQDRLVYALCRPERLLRLVYGNIVFDNGVKKIARYQQFFTVEDILRRVRAGEADAPRVGGVVWHTQGSGKSLTMVLLAKALVLAPDIRVPKVILVTDRIDLDDQICNTFRACGFEPEQAATGQDLVRLLADDKAHVVTTLIHKFEAAAGARNLPPVPRDTFVLVDEGHRSNYNERHARMKLALKGACFIAFTGTPLAKTARKNTFAKFGPLFKPPYTIARAVEDRAVVPLLYEARHVPQSVEADRIDGWFEKLTLGLTDAQKADLKRKYSSDRQLNKAEAKLRMVAWDVSMHFQAACRGANLKGQLVAPDKESALRYREHFRSFGLVDVEVLISAPDTPEGEGDGREPSERETVFWKEMMDRYGTERKYNELLINAFKKGDTPEILIVVDKLLTGFDAPRNAVLYLARPLREHTLLQAIARVNRLCEGKEYGLILDYSGVISDLDEALEFYDRLAGFDEADLAETVRYVSKENEKLPQLHSNLWDLFPGLRGVVDPEAFIRHLRDEERRNRFYDRFAAFARGLSLALSSTSFLERESPETVHRYKEDLKFFQGLRAEVSARFQEKIRFSEYEPKIRRLIDTQVGADEVVPLCDPINLFDAREREALLEDGARGAEAKADMIASATQRVIEQELAKDPAFYGKFSRLIQESLDKIHSGRVAAIEELPKLDDYARKVATRTDEGLPEVLETADMGRRYFGVVKEDLAPYAADPDASAHVALEIQKRLAEHRIRDFRDNPDALNRMRNEIDDIFFEMRESLGVEIPLELQDKLIDQCIEITIANED